MSMPVSRVARCNPIEISKIVNTVRVNADRGHDYHRLADHMTKLRNFTKAEFLAFPFSL